MFRQRKIMKVIFWGKAIGKHFAGLDAMQKRTLRTSLFLPRLEKNWATKHCPKVFLNFAGKKLISGKSFEKNQKQSNKFSRSEYYSQGHCLRGKVEVVVKAKSTNNLGKTENFQIVLVKKPWKIFVRIIFLLKLAQSLFGVETFGSET